MGVTVVVYGLSEWNGAFTMSHLKCDCVCLCVCNGRKCENWSLMQQQSVLFTLISVVLIRVMVIIEVMMLMKLLMMTEIMLELEVRMMMINDAINSTEYKNNKIKAKPKTTHFIMAVQFVVTFLRNTQSYTAGVVQGTCEQLLAMS